MVISVYSVGRTYILVGGGPRRVAPSCEMVSARSRLQIWGGGRKDMLVVADIRAAKHTTRTRICLPSFLINMCKRSEVQVVMEVVLVEHLPGRRRRAAQEGKNQLIIR